MAVKGRVTSQHRINLKSTFVERKSLGKSARLLCTYHNVLKRHVRGKLLSPPPEEVSWKKVVQVKVIGLQKCSLYRFKNNPQKNVKLETKKNTVKCY